MSKGKTIVIVEDDVDDQEVLRDVIESLNTKKQLLFFSDSNEAYNYLMSTDQKPFLIFCDINMPKVNGIELKQKIDGTDLLRRKAIPFVFFTTSDNPNTVDQAYQITNLQGYFRKGHAMEELRQSVKCIIDYWSTALHPTTG